VNAYIISPFFQILDKKSLNLRNYKNTEEVQKLKKGELFLLYNKNTEEQLLINPAIYTFLHFFRHKGTLKAVTEYLSHQTQMPYEEVAPIAESFLKDMLHRNILLTSGVAHQVKKKIEANNTTINTNTKKKYIDNYLIIKELSKNSPKEVYLVEDTKSNTKAVLKMLKPEGIYGDAALANMKKEFRKEFGILKELNGHPHIAQFLKYTEGQQYIYGVTQYISNVMSIRKRLEDRAMPPQYQRLKWYGQVLNAFSYIHAKGIIHGDVHTSNILLSNNESITIIDFDMAHHACVDYEEIMSWGGVHTFIPPEKINLNAFEISNAPADFRSEVFQLAIVGYFLIYGKMPFYGVTWETLAAEILNNEPSYKPYQEEEVLPAIKDFLAKALDKDPNIRYINACQMYEAWLSIPLSIEAPNDNTSQELEDIILS
jgi:eukaryotic-like serine/threonine-protein kinase